MASAAEQLAANINWSAFAKADELKKRIWFTLGALVIFRLGTYIPLPGIDSGGVPDRVPRAEAGRARHVQHVLGRRRAAHGGVCAEHHAVYLRLDHHPAPELGDALARGDQERGRAGAQGPQPIHALSHRVPRDVPGLWHRDRPRRAGGRRQRSGPAVPHLDGRDADRRDDVPRLARRADHLARRRQRLVAHHFRRHRRAPSLGDHPAVRDGPAGVDLDRPRARRRS